jgi:membrane-associated phospholipid phosphatase
MSKVYGLFLFFVGTILMNAQISDITILREIHINKNEALTPSLKFVTNSVGALSVATPIILYSVGLIKKDSTFKKQAIFVGQTLAVSTFVTYALKHSIKRARPYETYADIERDAATDTYSFPSGHTSMAFATATALSMAHPKWYVIAPSFAWAGAVGYSRLHLGVHYPTDVLAGAIVGSGSAYLSYRLNKWINKKKYKKVPQLWDGVEK